MTNVNTTHVHRSFTITFIDFFSTRQFCRLSQERFSLDGRKILNPVFSNLESVMFSELLKNKNIYRVHIYSTLLSPVFM